MQAYIKKSKKVYSHKQNMYIVYITTKYNLIKQHNNNNKMVASCTFPNSVCSLILK